MTTTPTGGGGKRAIDLLIAIPATVLLAPVMALVALTVRAAFGRPVLFRHTRPGWRGQPFELLKFRTMTSDRGADGRLLPDAQRLTPVGRLLRRTSVDELPELFNVLRGEMSLVGPRPLLMAYLDRYEPWQARRHEARPGITGLAQVRGRNQLDWNEKFTLDVWYVDHWSVALDLKILGLTLWTVCRGEGIHQPDRATADEFKGSAGR